MNRDDLVEESKPSADNKESGPFYLAYATNAAGCHLSQIHVPNGNRIETQIFPAVSQKARWRPIPRTYKDYPESRLLLLYILKRNTRYCSINRRRHSRQAAEGHLES
jgi:hypothetical protein